jgi:AcrR family transcriptional regulator
MENVVSTLAGRSLAERHEAYATEIRTLLDAALVVMRRDETIDPRVSDIVATAGLSNQAFYRHFRGKDELLVALLDDGRQRLLTTIERRMARAEGATDQVRAWIDAVLAQARDPEAAAATRPFALNGDRLAVKLPGETQGSRDRLVEPLRELVGDAAAVAIYHVAMGTVHDALVERRTPTRAESEAVVEFALKGAGLGT